MLSSLCKSKQCVFIYFLSPCRHTVPRGQLHTAASCVSQEVDAKAGRVLHRQSLHQRPGDDAHFVSSGNSLIFFTQVWPNIWAKSAPQLLFRRNIRRSLFVQISLSQSGKVNKEEKWQEIQLHNVNMSKRSLWTPTIPHRHGGYEPSLCSASCLWTGGCLERWPVSSTPCVACCSACVVWPTWQRSLWCAASKSVFQTTVRRTKYPTGRAPEPARPGGSREG